jgi:hypothetical protein
MSDSRILTARAAFGKARAAVLRVDGAAGQQYTAGMTRFVCTATPRRPRRTRPPRLTRGAAILIPALWLLAASSDAADGRNMRILLVGNSYTAGTRRAFDQQVGLRKGVVAGYITPGGWTLEKHLESQNTTDTIRTGNWDVVVLQEQSQLPSLPGKHGKRFHESVDALVKLIRESGARPILYMTWGRRNGDEANPHVNPDYTTMQDRLTAAYRAAGDRNGVPVAPVGEAWRRVRAANPSLGKQLYRKDGSHPSAKGAFLAACVLTATIFGEEAKLPVGEAELLKKCAREAVAAERARGRGER